MALSLERSEDLRQRLDVLECALAVAAENRPGIFFQAVRQVESQPQLRAVVEAEREVPSAIRLLEFLLGKPFLDFGLGMQDVFAGSQVIDAKVRAGAVRLPRLEASQRDAVRSCLTGGW